ncbi:MAG: DUF4159 domain-containing protein [Acidobacteriota bacterium]
MRRPCSKRLPISACVTGLLLAVAAGAQGPLDLSTPKEVPELSQFSFVRVEYDSVGGLGEAFYDYRGRIWQRWETDFPEGDRNFVFRLTELTEVHLAPEPITRRLTAPDLHQFPFLYMCDVGWMRFSEEEVVALRNYLLKGGFVWVDDFWGRAEWLNLEEQLRRVIPELSWRELPSDHPILSSVFQLDEMPQIPAQDFALGGWKHDPHWIHRYPAYGVETPHLRGYFDENDRLVVLATHNTDIGDGWEREAYGEWFFETYSTVAYAMGVNVVVYALTH